MTMHMDSARSEPTHYNTVQFGDQITVTEITTFGSSLRGNLTFTGGLSVERSGRVADDSLNARDTLGRNRPLCSDVKNNVPEAVGLAWGEQSSPNLV